MEKSKLESLPDKQLIQYLKYLLKIISDDYTLTTLNSFYTLFDDHELYSKAKAPIGGSLSRLDIEYIYWILKHNDIDETNELTRPNVVMKEVTYIEEYNVVHTTQRSTSLPTYVNKDMTPMYLNNLAINDDIDVFAWDDITTNVSDDFDLIQTHFIV